MKSLSEGNIVVLLTHVPLLTFLYISGEPLVQVMKLGINIISISF